MNIADRIQHLRKGRGISQEELADLAGVSRQAVSKWESEQSMPDLDKIIILSEYFDVTTDYLLKGIETPKQAESGKASAGVFTIVATVMDFIGLILSCAIWYEKQMPVALVAGLIFMALGCMIFGVGLTSSAPGERKRAKQNFWTVNIWLLSFLPLSFVYNLLFFGQTAPYPLFAVPLAAFPIFWAVYIALCLGVVYFQVKTRLGRRNTPS